MLKIKILMDPNTDIKNRILLFLIDYYSKNSGSNILHNIEILKKIGMLSEDFNTYTENYDNTSLEELSKFKTIEQKTLSRYLENHDIIENIGSGGYGYIFKTFNKLDKHSYALKIQKVDHSIQIDEKILEECRVMASLDHPNIIRYYSSWFEKKYKGDIQFYIEDDYDSLDESLSNKSLIPYSDTDLKINMYLVIQMELCEKDLSTYILNRKIIDYNEILNINLQIVQGLDYLHKKNIIHRDIKPSNIFLTKDKIIKLGDFGMSKQISNTNILNSNISNLFLGSDEYGTQTYLSPETIENNTYSVYSDIYSLGIIFFELLNIFPTHMERFSKIKNVKIGKFDDKFFKKYKKECAFILKLIDDNPHKRLDTHQILNFKI